MTEQVQTQEQSAPKTVKIEDKVYTVESLTEAGVNLINNIQSIDQVIARHQLEMGIAGTAKSTLIQQLVQEAVNFTEVPQEEATGNDTSDS